MRILFILALAALPLLADTCPATVPAGVSTCYFVANGGDDNAAGTKAAPWAHLPKMPSWTGSHTVAKGEGFIHKGGDSWTEANFPMTWDGQNGTEAQPIYIGYDSTWYTGASWSRPKWDCQGTYCVMNAPRTMVALVAQHVIVDNIDFTGLFIPETDAASYTAYVVYMDQYQEVKNSYFHGWTTSVDPDVNYHPLRENVSAAATCSGTCATGYSYDVLDLAADGGHSGTSDDDAAFVLNAATLDGTRYNTISHTCGAGAVNWRLQRIGPEGASLGSWSGADSISCSTTTYVDSGQTATIPRIYTKDLIAASGYTAGGVSAMIGTSFHHNVVDGSDTLKNTGVAAGNFQSIYNNVFRYVFTGLQGAADSFYGNLIEHIDFWAASGAHCNPAYHMGPIDAVANTIRIFNNVIRDSSGPGCVIFFVNNLVDCPTCTTYFYNNLIYGLTSGSNPIVGAGQDINRPGTEYFYNNTVVPHSSAVSCFGNGNTAPLLGEAVFDNNHCVTETGAVCYSGGAITCTDGGHNKKQTAAEVAVHYNSTAATYPYSPKDGSAEGVGAGADLSSLVATIGSDFGSDLDFACSYNSTEHTVSCPTRTALFRPNAAWDAGAYQYSEAAVSGASVKGGSVKGGTLR